MSRISVETEGLTDVVDLESAVDELLELAKYTEHYAEHRQVLVTMAVALETRALRWAIAGLPARGEDPVITRHVEATDDHAGTVAGHLTDVEIAINEYTMTRFPVPPPHWIVRVIRWFRS
jgi:hypothetical protein